MPSASLAALLVHEDTDLQRQGSALLDSAPELDTPDLDRHLAAALLERCAQVDWWPTRQSSLRRSGRQLTALFALRLGWARRLCRQHQLPWEAVEIFLALHAPSPRQRWLTGFFALSEGVIRIGSQRHHLEPDLLQIPLPEAHPLRAERAWIRRTGQRLHSALRVYLPLPEEALLHASAGR